MMAISHRNKIQEVSKPQVVEVEQVIKPVIQDNTLTPDDEDNN
jgi:hypothetical protein